MKTVRDMYNNLNGFNGSGSPSHIPMGNVLHPKDRLKILEIIRTAENIVEAVDSTIRLVGWVREKFKNRKTKDEE